MGAIRTPVPLSYATGYKLIYASCFSKKDETFGRLVTFCPFFSTICRKSDKPDSYTYVLVFLFNHYSKSENENLSVANA